MDGLGNALGQAFGCLITIIVVLGIGLLGFAGYSFFKDDSIKSKHPIKPRLELVIENNKVDTLYVYEKPKS